MNMKIKVKIEGKTKTLDMEKDSNVRNIFEKLDESTEMYVVRRGKEIVIEEDKLKDGDKIEFIKVVSGG